MEFSCSGDSGQNPIGDMFQELGRLTIISAKFHREKRALSRQRSTAFYLRHGPPACWPAQAGTIFDLGELGSEKKKS